MHREFEDKHTHRHRTNRQGHGLYRHLVVSKDDRRPNSFGQEETKKNNNNKANEDG